MAANEPVQIGFRELYDMLVLLRDEVREDRQDTVVKQALLEKRVSTLEEGRAWVRNVPHQIPAWIISLAAIAVAIIK